MLPKCCKKCERKEKESCAYYVGCAAWRSWFKSQWDDIRAAVAQDQEEKNAKAAGTSSLCLYTTDPCSVMKKRSEGK